MTLPWLVSYSSSNNIGASGAASLAKGLRLLTSLCELDLRCFSFVCSNLVRSLFHVGVCGDRAAGLTCSFNGLELKGATAIADSLSALEMLQVLNMRYETYSS